MSSWENEFKNPVEYMIMEDGDFLLLEQDTDGATETDYIVLNQTGQSASLWDNQIKN